MGFCRELIWRPTNGWGLYPNCVGRWTGRNWKCTIARSDSWAWVYASIYLHPSPSCHVSLLPYLLFLHACISPLCVTLEFHWAPWCCPYAHRTWVSSEVSESTVLLNVSSNQEVALLLKHQISLTLGSLSLLVIPSLITSQGSHSYCVMSGCTALLKKVWNTEGFGNWLQLMHCAYLWTQSKYFRYGSCNWNLAVNPDMRVAFGRWAEWS